MTTRERVKELETRLEVDSLKVVHQGHSFQCYPWLKGRIFHKLITGHETMQKRNFALYFRQITSIFYGIHNLFGRYKYWAFTSSMERRLIGEKYTDKLFDPIGELESKTLIIELRLFKFYPRRKVASKRVMSRSFFLLFETLYAKTFARKFSIENTAVLDELNKVVEGGVQADYIIRKYIAQYRMMRFWLKILPNPKVVFLSVSYTHFGYILALKERGIKIVEFQHGVITENHHAYNYFVHLKDNQFPDVIATIGEREISVFSDENLFPVQKIVPIGSFIIDKYVRELLPSANIKKKILFTLQDGIMGEKLLRFALKVREIIDDSFLIIMQPRRTAKMDYVQQIPEVSELEFTDQHFYKSLSESYLHATIYSTTAIESLSLGVPNILINIDNQSVEQLPGLLKNPFTKIVESPLEFCDAIEQLKDYSRLDVTSSNTFNVKPSFKENLKELLRDFE